MSDDRLSEQLKKRMQSGSYRSLHPGDVGLIDFSSNDYLGLASSEELKELIINGYQRTPGVKNGSTGSRLLTGSSPILEETESFLSKIFHAEAGLFFSSGYMANLAFFSSVPQKGDTLLYDELSHACIKDGSRLSLAQKFPFKHNDLNQLEAKIKKASGQVYIACESVYSMDGDFAPLNELSQLAAQYNARLVVDEAHSTGIFGQNGNGLVNELGLGDQVYATIYTFGKAMGVHGAFIKGNETLRNFLINFARPFIYTTAPSDFEALAIKCAFLYLETTPSSVQGLHKRIYLFRELVHNGLASINSQSAIQAILVPGNAAVKATADHMKSNGFDIRPILSPTVREGEERLRICLHSFNSEEEIRSMAHTLNKYLS